ncbi:hypothetical protein LSH36_922g01013 [Paralvinella palmiformis]|uniref:Uncharacterized protein n=1 Tax=Paralvinella palmiformis TaxID=53620 RepID=A0AAD9MTR6_9ANNE|nr:hypothetical protein LSH36_922g01013 [Paralvinella palmiformis]
MYLADISVLPPEVLLEFQEGNFVVKQPYRRFNQVSADKSTEWLHATGKNSMALSIGLVTEASRVREPGAAMLSGGDWFTRPEVKYLT